MKLWDCREISPNGYLIPQKPLHGTVFFMVTYHLKPRTIVARTAHRTRELFPNLGV
jgi:hypothetical protein